MASARRYDIDWLRNTVVCVVLAYHAMGVFVGDPQLVLYVKDPDVDSWLFGQVAVFTRPFLMPLLFLLAGCSAWYSLRKRSAGTFIKERFTRLGIPLFWGTVLLVPPMTWFYPLTQNPPGQAPSLFTHWIGFFRIDLAHTEGLTGTLTPSHLWFILFLLVLSVVALPVLLPLRGRATERLRNALARFSLIPGALLLWSLPLMAADALDVMGSKSPVVFLLLLVYGFILASDERHQEAIDRYTVLFLVLALVIQIFNNHLPEDVRNLPLFNLGRWCWMLALMGLFHRYLNRPSEGLARFNTISFPFYIIHLPVLTVFSYFLIRLPLPYPVLWLLLTAAGAAATLTLCLLAARFRITRWMLGMK